MLNAKRYLTADVRQPLEILAALSRQDVVVFDVETNGLHPYHGDYLVGLALYFPHCNESYYLPSAHEDARYNIPNKQDQLDILLQLQRSPATKIGFNTKFDMHMVSTAINHYEWHPALEDAELAAHAINPNEWLSNGRKRQGAYRLKRLAAKYLGDWATEGEDELRQAAAEAGVDGKKELWKIDVGIVAKYAMLDVEITWALREFYRLALIRWGMWDYYLQRCSHIAGVFRMEKNGVYVDRDLIAEHMAELGPMAKDTQGWFNEHVGRLGYTNEINLNSPAQVKKMFSIMGHTLQSTDRFNMEVLEAQGVEVAAKVLEWRTISKATSTYYEPYLKWADESGIIRPSFRMGGTKTGRFSSLDPNLQQVPKKKGYIVKQVFQPREGYTWVQLDYDRLELALATTFAHAETMRENLLNADAHQYTADYLTKELGHFVDRDMGKAANFGMLYGMGGARGAREFRTSVVDARNIVDAWNDLYPEFRTARTNATNIAAAYRTEHGATSGKWQYIRQPISNRVMMYHEFGYFGEPAPYKDAWNFIIQGLGSWINEVSQYNVMRVFNDDDIFKPTLTVHDAFIGEIRTDMVDEVLPEIIAIMEDWPEFLPGNNPQSVPMTVGAEISTDSWADLKSYRRSDVN